MLYFCICFIYIYQIVVSVCLFVCPIITHQPWDRFTSNFDRGTLWNHGNVFSLVFIKSLDSFQAKLANDLAGFHGQVIILSIRKYAGSRNIYRHHLLIFPSFLIRKIMVFKACDQSPLTCEDISARFTLTRVGKPLIEHTLLIYHFLFTMVFILYIT